MIALLVLIFLANKFLKSPSEEEQIAEIEGTSDVDQVIKSQHDFFKSKERPILFYGRVIDENGNPLKDVELKFRYSHYSMLSTWSMSDSNLTRISDADGEISIRGKRGYILTLESIKKDEYWVGEQKTMPSFDYGRDSASSLPLTKERAYTFILVKEIQDNYLIETMHLGNVVFVRSAEPITIWYNIIERHALEKENSDYNYDFFIESTYANKSLTIKFKGILKTDSFLISQKYLLTPEDLHRFSPEAVFNLEYLRTPKDNRDIESNFYLYIKSRKLGIYTRASIQVSMSDTASSYAIDFVTNPYGEIEFRTFDRSKSR